MKHQLKWLGGAALFLGGWISGFVMGDRVALSPAAVRPEHSTSDRSFQAPASVAQTIATLPQADWQAKVSTEPQQSTLAEILAKWTNPIPPFNWDHLRSEIQHLTVEQIREALAQAPRVKYENRSNYVHEFILRWAVLDPEGALQWAASLPGGSLQSEAFGWVCRGWARKDSSAAAAAISRLAHDDLQRAWGLSLISEALISRGELAEATELITQLPVGSLRDRSEAYLAGKWAENDPAAALAYLTRDGAGSKRESFGNIVYQWMLKDRDAALDWCAQMPPGEDRKIAHQVLAGMMTSHDPETSVKYWLSNAKDSTQAADALVHAAGIYANQNRSEALAWAQKLPDGPLKNRVFAIVVERLATLSPTDSLRLLPQLSETDQLKVSRALGKEWTKIDAAAAQQWITQLPEGAMRREAVAAMAQQMVSTNPMATVRWLDQLPNGPSRDAAIGAFAGQFVQEDPLVALSWTGAIGNAQTRAAELERITRQWLQNDREAARQWISQSSALSEEARRRLISAY